MPRYQMIAEFYAPDDLTADRKSWAAGQQLTPLIGPKINVCMVVPLTLQLDAPGESRPPEPQDFMAMEKPRDRKEQGY